MRHGAGNVSGFKMPEAGHARQLERVGFVRLSLQVFEQPSFFMSAADDDGNFHFKGEVVEPTAGAGGFDNDQVNRIIA